MQKKKYTLLIFFIILSIIGIAVIPKLSFQLNPTIESKSIIISCKWPRASPLAIEQQVTSTIEGACATLQNIKKIKSWTNNGYGSVILQLEKNADPTYLRFEVATLMRQLYQRLPKGTSYPQVSMRLPNEMASTQALMVWQLNGNSSDIDLQEKAETILKPSLSQIPGIAEVNVQGAGENEWVLSYKNEQLQSLDIEEEEIVMALDQHFSVENLGKSITNEGKEINVSLKNNLNNEVDWNIIICKRNQRIIYLRDIVKIEKKPSVPSGFYRINSKNAINITINAEKSANQIELAALIKKKIASLQKQLPKDFQLVIDYDASEYIKENLEKIADQVFLAILILIVFVWLSSWSWRYTLVVTTSLIVNLLLCNIVFFALKIELHLYSLAALTTSLGIVIDNTIVMIDYFKRYKNLRVFTALLGATLTTLAGLTVVIFLPENNKMILEDFAIVFTIALLISLFVSLFFVPNFHDFLAKQTHNILPTFKRKRRLLLLFNRLYIKFISFTLRYRKTFVSLALLTFGIPFGLIPEKLEEKTVWQKTYNQVMDSDNIESILSMLEKVFGGTFSVFLKDVYQKSYYSDPERTALHINIGLPNNSTLEQINDICIRIESSLKNQPQLDKFITNIHNGQDAEIIIFFKKEFENQGFPFFLKNKMVDLSTEMSGINCDIYGVGEGFSVTTDEESTPAFSIKLQGYNYQQLEKLALALKQRLEKHQRIQNLDINGNGRHSQRKKTFEFQLLINSKAIVQNNFEPITLYNALHQQNQEADIDTYINIKGKNIPVKVLPENHNKFDIWQLNNESVLKQNKKNKQARVKLQDIASLTKQKIATDIVKENQQYIKNITLEYIGSNTRGNTIIDQAIELEKANYPIGYTIEKDKQGDWDKENKQQYWLIALVIAIIYIICAIIFESLKQPLALILLVPISYVGVFLTFILFEFNFDQGGYAAFILLSGNVVAAAIFIISEYNLIQKSNPLLSPKRLYLKAFNHKIYPILLTILSTIVGLVPFLIYGQTEAFWFSLGAGTIGGLVMSMIAIFVYLPLFLLKKDNIKKPKIRNKMAFKNTKTALNLIGKK